MAKSTSTLKLINLCDHQVFQRNAQSVADLVFYSDDSALPGITCTVQLGVKPLRGFSKIAAQYNKSGQAKFSIIDLPCGGPYTILFFIKKELIHSVEHILVGDLWVMAGQSNMQGIGLMRDALATNAQVNMFSMRDEWKTAKDPINFCASAVDQAYRGQDPFRTHQEIAQIQRNMQKGVGPGLAFATYLSQHSKVPIGLIPCAKGGSAMHEWDYSIVKADNRGASLYGACMRRIQAAGGKITGVIWSQGCSDANPNDVNHYTQRMKTLVNQFRKDLKQNVPWIITQINGFYDTGRWNLSHSSWNEIRISQGVLSNHISKLSCVTSVDLDLDDGIHLSGAAQNRVGVRLAKVALGYGNYSLKNKKPISYQSPYIASISGKRGNQAAGTSFGAYAVRIKGLNGALISDGSKVLGFSLHDKDGIECKTIYKAWIRGDEIILQTELKTEELSRYQLYYGYGSSPICNISDDQDMGLLAAGPFDLRYAK